MREIHPVAAWFPDLSADEYAGLLASVREHGVLNPIMVDEADRVIDGRHRDRAADEAGVECPAEMLVGMSPWEYARTVNLDRRHLMPQQRVAVLLKAEQAGLAPEVVKIRKETSRRQSPGRKRIGAAGGSDKKTSAAERIGAMVGVGKTTVREVEAAVKAGGSDALDQIESGKKTAQQIKKAADKKLKKQVQETFFPAPTPVFDAWWKATELLTQKVLMESIDEEWGPDERKKIIEWTPRLIERLRAVQKRAKAKPMLTVKTGGRK